MTAYYNEFDPKAAAWLRELIRCGLIADGIVDERSIEDVTPADLAGHTQVHFFAGIGVWSYALRAAGWPDDRPVWTGSCPCQPFSAAGKGGGFADERHLWPAFHYLIDQCRPDVVFGEQVASKDGLGWLDLVQADLEGTGYASGAVDLCAAGVGAPHIRQRLWWFGERMDDDLGIGRGTRRLGDNRGNVGQQLDADGAAQRLANGAEPGRQSWGRFGLESDGRGAARIEPGRLRDALWVADFDSVRQPEEAWTAFLDAEHNVEPRSGHERLVDHSSRGRERGGQESEYRQHRQSGEAGGMANDQRQQRSGSPAGGDVSRGWDEEPAEIAGLRRNSRPGPTNGLWADADWLHCRDGKWRPVEPGTFPLAHGASERVGRLRGYGNAIVAPCAQAFIEAYLETSESDGRRLCLGVFE